MKPRTQARSEALQILYQMDLNADMSGPVALRFFQQNFSEKIAEEMDDFTLRLVTGVLNELDSLDVIIRSVADNWRLERMAAVDRNLLRLGAFELEHCDDIPATVTINELLEVAKRFGSETSPGFINGILDKIKEGLDRPNKAP